MFEEEQNRNMHIGDRIAHNQNFFYKTSPQKDTMDNLLS